MPPPGPSAESLIFSQIFKLFFFKMSIETGHVSNPSVSIGAQRNLLSLTTISM